MNNEYFLTYWWCITLLGFAALWWCRREYAQQAKIEVKLEAEFRQINLNQVEYIEEGLVEWLDLLELPHLADQTKRQEAARQLRIVLVERLMNGPVIR